MQSNHFNLTFNPITGGVTTLKRQNDLYDTDYLLEGATLGVVIVRYRVGQGSGTN